MQVLIIQGTMTATSAVCLQPSVASSSHQSLQMHRHQFGSTPVNRSASFFPNSSKLKRNLNSSYTGGHQNGHQNSAPYSCTARRGASFNAGSRDKKASEVGSLVGFEAGCILMVVSAQLEKQTNRGQLSWQDRVQRGSAVRRGRHHVVRAADGTNLATSTRFDDSAVPQNGSSTSSASSIAYDDSVGATSASSGLSPNSQGDGNAGTALQPQPGGQSESQDVISVAVMAEVMARLQRLQVLVLLRRMYRDVLRSMAVLSMPIPKVAVEDEENGAAAGEVVEKKRRPRRRIRNWLGSGWRMRNQEEEEVELVVESPVEILEYVEDIKELAVSLKQQLEGLDGQLGVVFQNEPPAEKVIAKTVVDMSARLEALAERVEKSLGREQMERALALRAEQSERDEKSNVQIRVLRRLEESLPKTGQVLDRVRRRIATVDLSQVNLNFLQRASYDVLQTVGDVWRRLNGRPDPSSSDALTAGLPRPTSVFSSEEERKLALILQVEALDKKLGEASRTREQRLRQKNALARTRLASEIRSMDDEVNEVRKELAVRTLQVEMSIICLSLEAELLDVTGSQDIRTDEEESLLVAEFGLLDADLARLRAAVDRREAILVADEELEVLATDIPDLKSRLGIVEEASIPLGQRASITVQESVTKLKDGASFYWRGMRLLGGDINYSFRLFWAAVTGTTLKPREVQAVRRTAKDVLVLIPFSIILIAPITPIGHVLAFSFLQKYFPGFFPSSFTPKRQEVMKRYELIKTQLQLAASDREKEEAMVMAAEAAAETFGAAEEDTAGPAAMAHGGNVTQTASSSRLPRRLTDRPANLLLLQERIPEMARILSSLKVEAAVGDKAARDRSATKALTERPEDPKPAVQAEAPVGTAGQKAEKTESKP